MTGPHPLDAERLLGRADELGREAAQVLADLDLLGTLSRFGRVVRTGSSAYALMTARDIDVYVFREAWTPALCWAALAAPFGGNESLQSIRLSKWVGRHATPAQPEGYSAVLRHRPPGGEQWRIDVWFFPPEAADLRLRWHAELTADLPSELRLAILWIKDVWHDDPAYVSADVYEAVLHHGVRTPADFERYLRTR